MDYGPALLAATQGISAFHMLMPPLADIREAPPGAGSKTKKNVRVGEFAACSITLAVGALIAVLVKNSIPVIIAAVICLVMVFVYETVLNVDNEEI